MKREIENQVKTKAGLAIKGAIGIDQMHPLGYVADLEVDCSKGNYFRILMKGNLRLQLVNMLPGSYIFIITQDAIGSRSITYNSQFSFIDGFDGVLSSAAGAIDMLSCTFDGIKVYSVLLKNFT